MEMMLMQKSLPDPQNTASDIDALNLNVSVPKLDGDLRLDAKLPVFVWIHGGGFRVGANNWPQYDQTRLLELSVTKGLPVIGVSIK